MKKILVATTILSASVGVAAADVTLSGSARMGIVSGFSDNNAANGDESDLVFNSRVRVIFSLSNETDSGLAFGASIRADNAAGGAAGDAGEVFISGAFGKLTMGDVDGAAQMATGHVAGVGYVGVGDLNESTFLGAGDGATDPTALYEYSAGDFTVYASVTNPQYVNATVAPQYTKTQALALGAKYTFGDYTIGLGYENLTSDTGASAVVATTTTDLDHVVLKVSGKISGFNVQGLIGQADGTRNSVVINNAKQYAMSVGYTVDALSGTVFYTDDSALPSGATAFGIGASYDLGGAAVSGGIVKNVDTKETGFDLGITMSF